MIVNTGMRTDIPAFYSKWFMNRIKEGYVLVRNPYNPSSVTRYNLNPEVVDLIAFGTKNPKPMLDYLEELKNFHQFWFVTITPYGKDIEPNVPDKERVMDAFKQLSDKIGADCTVWRYDPILITEKYSIDFHIKAFERMAHSLAGYTHTCIISFIDIYKKVVKNFPQAKEVSWNAQIEIVKAFFEIAEKYKLKIKACAEDSRLEQYGIDCSGCMTIETFENALNCKFNAPKPTTSRSNCTCYLSSDIGAYDTCTHFCRYCYANSNHIAVLNNIKKHNPDSPFLIGAEMYGDKIVAAKQESWIDNQLTMF